MRSWTKSGSGVDSTNLPIKLSNKTFQLTFQLFASFSCTKMYLHVVKCILVEQRSENNRSLKDARQIKARWRPMKKSNFHDCKISLTSSLLCPFLGATAWVERELTSNLKAKQFNCCTDKQRNSSQSWIGAQTNANWTPNSTKYTFPSNSQRVHCSVGCSKNTTAQNGLLCISLELGCIFVAIEDTVAKYVLNWLQL